MTRQRFGKKYLVSKNETALRPITHRDHWVSLLSPQSTKPILGITDQIFSLKCKVDFKKSPSPTNLPPPRSKVRFELSTSECKSALQPLTTPSSKYRRKSANGAIGIFWASGLPTLSTYSKSSLSTPLILSYQPTQYVLKLSSKGMLQMQSTSKRSKRTTLNGKLGKADPKFGTSLLNKPTNPGTSDLSRYRRQPRSPKSTVFHLSHLTTAVEFPAQLDQPAAFHGYRQVPLHPARFSLITISPGANQHATEANLFPTWKPCKLWTKLTGVLQIPVSALNPGNSPAPQKWTFYVKPFFPRNASCCPTSLVHVRLQFAYATECGLASMNMEATSPENECNEHWTPFSAHE